MEDDTATLQAVLEQSRRTAEREERRRQRHPSTTAREVRCFEGVNQRALGRASACTHFAAAFVARAAAAAASGDVTAEWLLSLLMDPGVALPSVEQRHPDPCAVVAAFSGLAVRGGDSLCVTGGASALATLLRRELASPALVGALVLNGTETFGVAKFRDGAVGLFDSHGDSTQTEPAFALVWPASAGTDAAALGISDFFDERSDQQQFELGGLLDVVLIDRS